ncbi:MAG TPA: hypothetical protein VJ045_10480 [Hyphomicrobiaceae bacterium]|nr:hypothetical protein [Hyphomicrobiaceae bacterium]
MQASSLVLSMIVLTVSVCAVILSAAIGAPVLLMAVTGSASLGCAWLAIREARMLEAAGASRSAIASSDARYMGFVWAWGALVLLTTYLFILQWRDWWQFVIALALVGAFCLWFAAALERDAEAGREDETMLTLGRYLAIGQLAGMIVAVAGLAIDPDKQFLSTNRPDWAANSIFLFGALAVAAISAHALLRDRRSKTTNKAPQ